jgi:hypothetical protein
MAKKDIKRIGEVINTIFTLADKDVNFITRIEEFLTSCQAPVPVTPVKPAKKIAEASNNTLDKIDLFQLIREQPETEVEKMLDGLTVKDLKQLLKRYHFGSPSKLKSAAQVKDYILN